MVIFTISDKDFMGFNRDKTQWVCVYILKQNYSIRMCLSMGITSQMASKENGGHNNIK